ncbi:MAG: peptide ABC transporter substrate-binding protein [Candidatus Anammoxibacter sp.]
MTKILLIFILPLAILFGITAAVLHEDEVDFTFVNGPEPETVDPQLATGSVEAGIIGSLFEGLTTYNPSDLSPEPGIAKEWNISDNGLVYTFVLRKSSWSNNEPLTAHDFVYSWRRALLPETAADYAYQLYYIKNAKPFNEGIINDFMQVGVKAINDYTLQVTLESNTPFFINLTSFPTLLPVNESCIEKHGDNWTRVENIVTNGPFCLEKWNINQYIIMKKNPLYWDADNVTLNKIKSLTVESINTGFNIYEAGNADIISTVPLPLVNILTKRDDYHQSTYLATYFYRFNVNAYPFNDVRVRKAFNLAVNKDSIVKYVTKGGEIPAKTFVPAGMPGYLRPDGLTFDVSKAKKLLADAGYPTGKGFPEVELIYNTSESNKDIAEVLQQMWKENLNVNVRILNQEWKVFLNTTKNLDYQISRASWIGDYVDPNTFLDMFVTNGGNNRTGWSNPQYDSLIKMAAIEQDTTKRFDLFKRAERILVEDELPIIPLYFYVSHNMYRDNIKGIYPNILNIHPFKFITKD